MKTASSDRLWRTWPWRPKRTWKKTLSKSLSRWVWWVVGRRWRDADDRRACDIDYCYSCDYCSGESAGGGDASRAAGRSPSS